MGFWDDVGNALASAAGAVADAVEGAVDTVVDAVEDAVNAVADAIEGAVDAAVTWVNENGGPILGGIAAVLGGLLNGFVEGLRDFVHGVCNIIRDVTGILADVLRLDFAKAIQDVVSLLIDLVGLAIVAGRTAAGGYLVGGVVSQFEREGLRAFVKGLIDDTFGADPERVRRIRERLRLGSADWGLRMAAQHRVLTLDSAEVPLWEWQADGTLDLYALAGVLSFDSFQVERPRTSVRVVGSDGADRLLPAGRWDIAKYLESRGAEVRLRVYAMDREAFSERLDVARDKCRKLGVWLEWDQETGPLARPLSHPIREKRHYRFTVAEQGRFALQEGLRSGSRRDECTLLGLGAFYLEPSLFGNTEGRDIREGDAASPCATAGRDDGCCSVVSLVPKADRFASSVVHRDFWPAYVFRYVLAHEIGHYLGLCHFGHDGFQNVMYTAATGANLSLLDWGLLQFYYQSEPEFSNADGRNAWRFIVSQLPCCLDESLC